MGGEKFMGGFDLQNKALQKGAEKEVDLDLERDYKQEPTLVPNSDIGEQKEKEVPRFDTDENGNVIIPPDVEGKLRGTGLPPDHGNA